jgi:hypothetical protein
VLRGCSPTRRVEVIANPPRNRRGRVNKRLLTARELGDLVGLSTESVLRRWQAGALASEALTRALPASRGDRFQCLRRLSGQTKVPAAGSQTKARKHRHPTYSGYTRSGLFETSKSGPARVAGVTGACGRRGGDRCGRPRRCYLGLDEPLRRTPRSVGGAC